MLIMNLRPGGMTIVQQEGVEVLGVNLSPSVSVKDRIVVRGKQDGIVLGMLRTRRCCLTPNSTANRMP